MQFARPAALACAALLAVVALPGCRTGGLGHMAPSPPAPIAPPASVTKAQIIDQNNRNARLVETLKASKLSIDVNVAERERHSVDGKMALERPRNFKLELNSALGKEADIGSNENGFWFWTRPRRGQPKEFYACNYDESGASPLEGPLQPDWIVEALGLHEITGDEAASIAVEPGTAQASDTLVLSRRIAGRSGTGYRKEMVVDKSSGLIREIRLYRFENERKVPLATALMSEHKKFPLASTETPGGAGAVILPTHVKLAWFTPNPEEIDVPRKLEIDVKLIGIPEINKPINSDLFAEFSQKGYTRIDLAERLGMPQPGTTSVRETRPAPPTGVELGAPSPSDEEKERDDSARSDSSPVALSAELPTIPSLAEHVVQAPILKSREPEYDRPKASTWRSVATPVLER